MGKNRQNRFSNQGYQNPFQQAWSSPKHASSQVNGETQQTQGLIVLEKQMRKHHS
ncbi:YpzG family protein [Priestia endophytica]|uniref:YpzG family protein n=2 Tax=Priestia endophytica TaxID=135735 RepID=A0A329ET52_9BACI|nr:YpzG family protein [Priestia endophytica]KAB2492522.1 YpzG family protein [Priestia endophytica]MCM3540494.1 YpzG family protein [Priestia endophytica]MED4071729.1 YpzG family protein [Priestia endophytica]RAS78565.1 YpzG family protein [Priestia endophytica]RAS80805.1 YpzG family protein [Priestia endophytica]